MKNATSGHALRILANVYAAQKASRDMTGGVLRYAAMHPGVEVKLYGLGAARRQIGELRDWKPDGVIVSTDDPAEIRRIERAGCRAAVFVNVEPPARTSMRCASVFCDGAAVAQAAADLFARKGLRHFAYVGTRDDDPWSREREDALRKCAAEKGASFSSFAPPRGANARPVREMAAMARWTAGLPKPCGLLAANDIRAMDALETCRKAGASVPERVMVLGVDDEEFICRQTSPTLSSVVPDFDRGGYLAMETLAGLLAGAVPGAERPRFGVRGVVERASTSDPNGAGRIVSRAKEYIRTYATTTDISVGDVAKSSGASVRLLQKHFRAIAGTTVSDAIQTVRLARVRELLEETATPIGRIGELCGFFGEAHLKKIFRRRYGCTMRDWRRSRRFPQ